MFNSISEINGRERWAHTTETQLKVVRECFFLTSASSRDHEVPQTIKPVNNSCGHRGWEVYGSIIHGPVQTQLGVRGMIEGMQLLNGVHIHTAKVVS